MLEEWCGETEAEQCSWMMMVQSGAEGPIVWRDGPEYNVIVPLSDDVRCCDGIENEMRHWSRNKACTICCYREEALAEHKEIQRKNSGSSIHTGP